MDEVKQETDVRRGKDLCFSSKHRDTKTNIIKRLDYGQFRMSGYL